MSVDKTKLEKNRIEEMLISTSLNSTNKEVEKAKPAVSAESGKVFDASTSLDAYMASIAVGLETLMVPSFAAEESVKIAVEDETIEFIPVEEEQSSGGAFSHQKGGSLAISLDAYIKAMNAQIESLKYRRERASLMIEQEYTATKYASNNVIKMGHYEKWGHFSQAIASGIGAGVQAAGSITMAVKESGLNKQSTEFETAKNAAEQKLQAIDELNNLSKLPANDPDRLAIEGWLSGGPGSAVVSDNNLIYTRNIALDNNTLTHGQKELVQRFDSIQNQTTRLGTRTKEEIQTEIVYGTNEAQVSRSADGTLLGLPRSDLKKAYQSELEIADGHIRRISNDRNAMITQTNLYTQTVKSLVDMGGHLGHGYATEARAFEEAAKMQNELAARYASQDVQLNNETAGARESDLSNSIRMLREVTGADIRG